MLQHHSLLRGKNDVVMFSVEAEWSSAGDVGDSADEDILDALFYWLWRWWRPPPIQVWQVQEFWVSSIYPAVLSLLTLQHVTGWNMRWRNWPSVNDVTPHRHTHMTAARMTRHIWFVHQFWATSVYCAVLRYYMSLDETSDEEADWTSVYITPHWHTSASASQRVVS